MASFASALRALPPLAQNLLLSVATTMLVFGSAESVCRILERRGQDAPPDESTANWASWEGEFYTARGWSPARDFNADGLRDRERAVAKLPGTRRLVCLGDSTTYGYHLRPEQAYPQVLQTLLDARGGGVEVFNVALPGWSARQELIAYRTICRKYHPDRLLLGVCLNDVGDMQNNLSRPPPALSWLYRRSAVVRRVVDAEGREIHSVAELFESPPAGRVVRGYQRLFGDIRELRKEAAIDGAGLAILVLPFRFQLAQGDSPPRPQETIASFCRAEGIPFIDALPELRRSTSAPFLDADHLSTAGARSVAELLVVSGLVNDWLQAGGSPGGEATSLTMLEDALEAADPAARVTAIGALERLGPAARSAAPALLARLHDPEETVRLRAADALVSIGPIPAWLPALRPLLEQGPPSACAAAARVVAALGPAGRDAVPSLVAALRRPGTDGHAYVAYALGQIGPDARAAVPELIGMVARTNDARLRAVDALGLIGDRAGVEVLCRGLEDPTGDMRWHAAAALGRIGTAAGGCSPALFRALDDPNDDVRMAAVRALPKLGVERVRLEAALEKLRSDPSGDVRVEVARALRRLRRPGAASG